MMKNERGGDRPRPLTDARWTPPAVAVDRPLAPEDQARADFYALLARLFADAPDAALLAAIAHAPPLGVDAGTDAADDAATRPSLPAAWDALRAASAAMDAEAVGEEYNDLFVGVGKSEVNLHASHWLTGFMMEKPLVEVRADARRARARAARRGVACSRTTSPRCCETMRILIAGHGARAPADDRGAARVFRASYRAVGIRLLRCNKRIRRLPTTTGG